MSRDTRELHEYYFHFIFAFREKELYHYSSLLIHHPSTTGSSFSPETAGEDTIPPFFPAIASLPFISAVSISSSSSIAMQSGDIGGGAIRDVPLKTVSILNSEAPEAVEVNRGGSTLDAAERLVGKLEREPTVSRTGSEYSPSSDD